MTTMMVPNHFFCLAALNAARQIMTDNGIMPLSVSVVEVHTSTPEWERETQWVPAICGKNDQEEVFFLLVGVQWLGASPGAEYRLITAPPVGEDGLLPPIEMGEANRMEWAEV